nr:4a-hydroxytetrahydrobiopterin dehydratase [uncultured Limnohabitans sp.]
MRAKKLNAAQIQEAAAQLDAWRLDTDTNTIEKTWTFDSFPTAMAFFAQAGALAERLDHHPEFLSTYTRMRVRLWTHDVNGLTHLDFELATAIDHLVATEFSQRVRSTEPPCA